MNVGHITPGAFPNLHDLVSKLQDTSARIQGIVRYVRNVAEELARDDVSLNVLTEQALHEVELALDNTDSYVRPSYHHAAHSDSRDPEEVEHPLQMRTFILFACDAKVR